MGSREPRWIGGAGPTPRKGMIRSELTGDPHMKTDSELRSDALVELKWEPSVDATHVGAVVEDGFVTLRVRVPSYAERNKAERVTRRVYGVKAVANELDVKPPGSSRR